MLFLVIRQEMCTLLPHALSGRGRGNTRRRSVSSAAILGVAVKGEQLAAGVNGDGSVGHVEAQGGCWQLAPGGQADGDVQPVAPVQNAELRALDGGCAAVRPGNPGGNLTVQRDPVGSASAAGRSGSPRLRSEKEQ